MKEGGRTLLFGRFIDVTFAWQAWQLRPHTTLSHTTLSRSQLFHTELFHTTLTHTTLSQWLFCGRRGIWWHRWCFCVADVALTALGWLWWRAWCGRRGTWWHRRCFCMLLCDRCGTYGARMALVARFITGIWWHWWCFCVARMALVAWMTTHSHTHNSHNSFTRTALSQTTLAHTALSHTTLWHTHTSFWYNIVTHTQLCHTQHFHTQLFPTQLFHPHSIFTHNSLRHTHTQLCDTHNIVTHTHNSLTRSSFTHTQLCHSQFFHTICLPQCPFSFLPFPSHFHICLVLIGRNLHVGLSGLLISFLYYSRWALPIVFLKWTALAEGKFSSTTLGQHLPHVAWCGWNIIEMGKWQKNLLRKGWLG